MQDATNGTHPAAESLDDILSVEALHFGPLYVPELGKNVYTQGLSGEDRDLVDRQVVERDDETGKTKIKHEQYRLAVVAMGLVNSKRERIASTPEACRRLNKTSSAALERIFRDIARKSAMTLEAVDDQKNGSEGEASSELQVA